MILNTTYSFGATSPPSVGDRTFADFVDQLITIINQSLIPALIAVLLVFIIWKVIDTLILHADDEQKRADGKHIILISIVAMSVIVAIWGIIAFLRVSIFAT